METDNFYSSNFPPLLSNPNEPTEPMETTGNAPSYSSNLRKHLNPNAQVNTTRKRYSFKSPQAKPGIINSTNNSRALITADHGIVIESASFPEYTNSHYFDAIKTIVPADQIHSFSRTQGTFQVFFLNVSWASQLKRDGLNMLDCRRIEVHPLGIPPTRVVVSEVPTHFDNANLREIMSDYGTIVGPIKQLRASHHDPDMPNLLSFRRQLMMKFPRGDFSCLPSRIYLDFNDVPTTFYVSTSVSCHVCGQPGHLRDACPNSKRDQPSTSNRDKPSDLTNPSTNNNPAERISGLETIVSGFRRPLNLASFIPSSMIPNSANDASSLPPPFVEQSTSSKRSLDSGSETTVIKRKSSSRPSSLSSSSSVMSSGSEASSLDEPRDDITLDSPPISDSGLDSLFAAMYRSKTPVLEHVRQHVNEPEDLLAYLKLLRSDKQIYDQCPLAKSHTAQSVYQWERKIRKALKLEKLTSSYGLVPFVKLT